MIIEFTFLSLTGVDFRTLSPYLLFVCNYRCRFQNVEMPTNISKICTLKFDFGGVKLKDNNLANQVWISTTHRPFVNLKLTSVLLC